MRLVVGPVCALVLLIACGDSSPSGNQNQNQNNNNDTDTLCGDGQRAGAEECDDGPGNSDTLPNACRTDCTLAHCGDGVLDAEEECDEGPSNSALVPDACRPGCILPSCGDGIVDVAAGEWCDCGEGVAVSHCTYPNGHPEGTCGPTCQVIICGNGVLDPGEACDDGNTSSGDGCSANCLSDETCGNGVVDAATEDCDDGGDVNHDGCHSLCVAEQPTWRERPVFVPGRASHAMAYLGAVDRLVVFGGAVRANTWELDGATWTLVETPATPIARIATAMAHDEARERVVLYGGFFGQNLLADTWEYDGVGWTRLATPTLPGGLAGHAMTFDSARGRTMLFGGLAVGGAQGDTWVFNGTDWSTLTTAHSPPPRFNARMAFDPIRGRVVLFGGCDALSVLGQCNGQTLGDTWEYDGSDWVQASPTVSPEGRSGHGMTWDASRNAVVLFGGRTQAGTQADLWTYNGVTWAPITAPGGPTARGGHALAYDPLGQRVVVQGGCAVFRDGAAPCLGAAQEDTWALSVTTWVDLTAPTPVLARVFAASAQDGRGRLMMHGGVDEVGTRADTWELHGGSWAPGAAGGPAVGGHAMAYDPTRDRVVLFGGCTSFRMNAFDICQGSGERAETWEYDGNAWALQSPTASPPARYWHGMVFDENRGTLLMHGGMVESTQVFDDTWEYDGTTWTQVTTTHSPPAVVLPSLVFDRARGLVVRAGGAGASLQFETWELDGVDWTERTFPSVPALRLGQFMAYDEHRQVTVLFGGCIQLEFQGLFFLECPVALDDTWEYDGQQWTPLGVTAWPMARLGSVGGYDTELRGVILGGGSDGVSVFFDDSWRYRWDAALGDERCDNGVDDDHDGLTDCADPDCEGRSCPDGLCQGGACVAL